MHGVELSSVYASLVLAGLAGSLHCLAMCGPLLLGFQRLTAATATEPPSLRRLALLDLAYHAGRVWTYGILGLLAGILGQGMQRGMELLRWQLPLSLALGIAMLVTGLLMLDLLPGLRVAGRLPRCALQGVQRGWLAPLSRAPGVLPRLLLGATLGLLPCGLVYAMLFVVMPLPTPLHSALGMLLFGLATVPALGTLVLGSPLLAKRAPEWLRRRSTGAAAMAMMAAGGFILARTVWVVLLH